MSIPVQFEILDSEPLGVGSNSKVYSCLYNGEVCVVKVPKNKEMYISSIFQIDSINHVLRNGETKSFHLPYVIDYFSPDNEWGELFFMEKMRNIYPLSFLLNTGMTDSRYVISRAAEAIAILHNCSISGYDVEFFWSYDLKGLVLLDLGPRFTINTDVNDMIYQQYTIAKQYNSRMAIWNMASELLDSRCSIKLFSEIIKGKSYPSIEDLLDAVEKDSEYLHVTSVARNHYLQIIGSCDNSVKQELVDIFVKKYLKIAKNPNMTYLQAFRDSLKRNVRSSKSFLYYSRYEVLSKMSNLVEISEYM